MGKKAKADLRTVPRGLQQAVTKAAKHIDGRYVYGLPQYGLDVKMKIRLVELGDLGLFEEHDIDLDENPDWTPFAMFKDEPQFLAIHLQAPYAVAMWEHEDGKFYPAWETFDDFVAKVIDKKDKTPFEKLDKQLERIGALVEDDAYADALGLIEPILATFPKLPPGRSFDDDKLSRAHNLHGLALKGVKRWAEAKTAFERSAQAGDTYAELNILDLYEDENKPRELIERALRARKDRYFDDYCRVWVARYLAFAHLDLGDPAKAEVELRKIVDDYATSDPEKVAKAREGLEKYVADARPGAVTATAFLAWFKPKTYDVTPEQAATTRAWWQRLPEGMRENLLKEINKKGEAAPSDEDLARCQDVDSLSLDEDDGLFDDAMLSLFLPLSRIERLGFYGDPDSIEVLRRLAKLTKLTVNNDVIKDFAWPSRADRDLWKAAEAGDRAGIEQALGAGASLGSRGDHGTPPLMMVAQTHDIALCKDLIARGADPWAGCHLDANDIFYFFGGDDKAALEAAAAKAGIPHPDADPYRELSVKRMPSGATFEKLTKLEDLELDEGVSLLDQWPAEVKIQMEPPKKDNKLYDLMRLGYDIPLVSEAVAEVLRGEPNVELLPVILVDHAKKVRPDKYYLLNPLVKDCLVVDQCHVQWNHIDRDSISGIAAFVFDLAKIEGARMFRPDRLNSRPVIIAKELAEKLAGFSGVSISYLGR